MPWNLLNSDVEISPEVVEDPRAADYGCLIRAYTYNGFIQCFQLMVPLVLKAVSILIRDVHYEPQSHEESHSCRLLDLQGCSNNWQILVAVSGLDSGTVVVALLK